MPLENDEHDKVRGMSVCRGTSVKQLVELGEVGMSGRKHVIEEIVWYDGDCMGNKSNHSSTSRLMVHALPEGQLHFRDHGHHGEKNGSEKKLSGRRCAVCGEPHAWISYDCIETLQVRNPSSNQNVLDCDGEKIFEIRTQYSGVLPGVFWKPTASGRRLWRRHQEQIMQTWLRYQKKWKQS